MSALRPYLELIRLPAVFTAPADVLAGAALATAGAVSLELALTRLVVLVAASAAVYCAGMAANDLFDLEIDRRERPGRPLPSGRVSVGRAWALVIGLQLAALSLAAWIGWTALSAVAVTSAATYLYNAALKDRLAGPVAMGACRYANALIGASIVPATAWPAVVWLAPIGTALFVASLTFLSRHEVDGTARAVIRGPLLAMLATAAFPALWPLLGALPESWAAAAVLLTYAWLARPLGAAWRQPDARTVRAAVMAGIFGIAWINAGLALAAGSLGLAAVAVGLLIPGRLVGRWFYAT